MDDRVEGAVFWLPSEILKDEDFQMDKENFNNNSESDSEFCFPVEFPYDFVSSSPVASSQIESDEDHLLAGLTRQFTLSSLGPVRRPSPHAKLTQVGSLSGRSAGPLCNARKEPSQREPSLFRNTHKMSGEHVVKQQNVGCGVWFSPQQGYKNRSGLGHSAWKIPRNAQQNGGGWGTRAVFLGESCGGGGVGGVNGGCTGTGVFLPRRYGNNNYSNAYRSNYRKKPGRSTAAVPDRAALAFHNTFDGMNSLSPSQPRPRFNSCIIPGYETWMLRNKDLLMQERRSLVSEPKGSMMTRNTYLPHEWTY